jgi:3'(2'), 5'-bisphosphate nucleotidase
MNFSSADLDYLINTIDQASQAVMQIYASEVLVEYKCDSSPVTLADIQANDILVNSIQQRWPQIPLLTEEASSELDSSVSTYWAIDPLDGTKEFISKNGQFTVNIALVSEGVPVVGLVAAPALHVMYAGYQGGGVKKRVGSVWSQLDSVNSEPNWSDYDQILKVAASRSHPSPELTEWLRNYPHHQLYEFGSSLKLCQVLDGEVDCYPRLGPTSIWDIAAGHALLKILGGELWIWPIEERQALRYSDVSNVLNPNFIAVGRPR